MSHKLQLEIDAMLSRVDDSKMYAEFREEELIEITDGVHHDIARESLDQRILINMNARKNRTPHARLQKSLGKTHEKASLFLKHLFKPIHI